MRRSRLPLALALAIVPALAAPSRSATGQVAPVASAAAFPSGAALLTFSGLATGTEVNGLAYGGVLFAYSLGNGQVVIDGGPGTTNNVAEPNVVSTGNSTGTLTLTLPGLYNEFGYGYAVLLNAAVPNATTITLFNGSTNVGSLSYAGAVDPVFTGGFAGIQSAAAFNRVDLTFTSNAPAFALDNVRFASTAPEPSTWVLLGTGLLAVGGMARRRRTKA